MIYTLLFAFLLVFIAGLLLGQASMMPRDDRREEGAARQ